MPRIEEPTEDEDQPVEVVLRRPSKDKSASNEVDVEVAVTMDRDKIKELVTTEISLERQLESVQSQLLALKQLPTEIEKHLQIVSEQLHKIMELSGVDQQQVNGKTPAEAAKGERKVRAAKTSGRVLKEVKDSSRRDARNPWSIRLDACISYQRLFEIRGFEEVCFGWGGNGNFAVLPMRWWIGERTRGSRWDGR